MPSGTLLSCIVLYVTVMATVTRGQDCSDSEKQCEQAFANSHAVVAPANIAANFPAWNETYEQLKDRCSRYSRFSLCMDDVISECSQYTINLYSSLDYAYNFLCSDKGLQTFVQYEKCFEQQNIKQGVEFCTYNYNSTMYNALKTSRSNYFKTYCESTETFMKCLKSTVSDCDADGAATWIYEWNRRLFYYTATNAPYNCPGWSDSDNAVSVWTIILSVVLGLTTLIMIIGIIIVCIFVSRKKKCRRPSSLPRPPPPYPNAPPYSNDPYRICETPSPDSDSARVTVTSPTASSSSGSAAVVMRPALVLPPPYSDKQAPAYEFIGEGATNGGFEEDVQEKKEENGLPREGETREIHTPEEISGRDMRADWF